MYSPNFLSGCPKGSRFAFRMHPACPHQKSGCIFAGMDGRKGFLVVVALVLIGTCFFPWVLIESRHLTIGGMHAEGTTYGKPGVLSFSFAVITLLFSFVPRVWAHRICIFCSTLNTGWALRNFILLSTCQGGECPQRQTAFYLYLVSSILLLVAVLVQEVKTKKITTAE